jgi:hypothetical protein
MDCTIKIRPMENFHRACDAGDAGVAGHQLAGGQAIQYQHGQFQNAQYKAGRAQKSHLGEMAPAEEVHGHPHGELQDKQQDIEKHQGPEPLRILAGDDVVCVNLLEEGRQQVRYDIHEIEQESDPEKGHTPPHEVADKRSCRFGSFLLAHSTRSLAPRKRVLTDSNR